MTACKECKHLIDHGSSYYERMCGVRPLSRFSAYEGVEKPNGYMLIGDVNFGACVEFEAKAVEDKKAAQL